MKISKNAVCSIRTTMQGLGDLKEFIEKGRSLGMSDTALMWRAWFAIGHKKQIEILKADGASIIGGYATDIKDSHIETALKAVFKDYL